MKRVKKINLLAFVFVPAMSLAQEQLPLSASIGCFMDSFSVYLSQCSQMDVLCTFSESDYTSYGYTTARLCERYGNALNSFLIEQKRANTNADIANNNLTAFNACNTERDTCKTSLSSSNNNSLNTLVAIAKQKQLITKLRKACGGKCKNIK